jgi:hypothetical protein
LVTGFQTIFSKLDLFITSGLSSASTVRSSAPGLLGGSLHRIGRRQASDPADNRDIEIQTVTTTISDDNSPGITNTFTNATARNFSTPQEGVSYQRAALSYFMEAFINEIGQRFQPPTQTVEGDVVSTVSTVSAEPLESVQATVESELLATRPLSQSSYDIPKEFEGLVLLSSTKFYAQDEPEVAIEKLMQSLKNKDKDMARDALMRSGGLPDELRVPWTVLVEKRISILQHQLKSKPHST